LITQVLSETVRLRPGMPFAFLSESAFTYAGILNEFGQAVFTLLLTGRAKREHPHLTCPM
jgi:hypothetical protein